MAEHYEPTFNEWRFLQRGSTFGGSCYVCKAAFKANESGIVTIKSMGGFHPMTMHYKCFPQPLEKVLFSLLQNIDERLRLIELEQSRKRSEGG